MHVKASSATAGKWILAMVLAIGAAGIWITLASWFMTTVLVGNRVTYETLVYAADGQPYIQSYDIRNYQSRSYRSLDGQRKNIDDQTWLAGATAVGDPHAKWTAPAKGWAGRINALSDGRAPATYWYYLIDEHGRDAALFVGYDSISQRKIGYLDASGFHAEAPRKLFSVPPRNLGSWNTGIASSQGVYSYGSVHEPAYYNATSYRAFPGWRVYLIDGNRLLEIDLRQRAQPPRVLLEQEGMLSVNIHAGFQAGLTPTVPGKAAAVHQSQAQHEALIVSTLHEVLVYDPVTNETAIYQRPPELVGKALNVYRPPVGGLIMEYTTFSSNGKAPATIYSFAADGSLAETNEISLSRGNVQSPAAAAAGFTVAAPLPLLAAFVTVVVFPLSKTQFDESLAYGDALLQSLIETGVYPLVTLLISAALAWLCYRRQRRYGDPVIWPWIVLIMLLGAPGYVGYRFHRRWPARLACPACRMPSPVEHAKCIDCGADWPRADAKGIEVYS